MGWLDKHHQRKVWKKFKIHTFYWCDAGDHPVPNGGLIVIDPRKGYHHRPRGTSVYVSKEPRWCSCYDCDQQRRSAIRHKKDHKHRKFLQVQSRVMELIEAKPKRGYWKKEKICHKLHKYTKGVVLRAIRVLVKERSLKKREGAYLPRRSN